MLHGSCLCGAVVFEALPDRCFVDCHCSQCRKQSGHFWAATSAGHDNFRLLKDDGLAWYDASPAARRGFCRFCGSFLFWQPRGENRISIGGGVFDTSTGLTIGEALFEEDAGDYYSPSAHPPAVTSVPRVLHGSCLCGENKFSLPGPMAAVTACHCTQCRKTSGHYSASFDAHEPDIQWQKRHLAEFVTPGGGRRGFCPSCGSSLFFRASDGGFSVEAGAIENPSGGRLVAHIFTAFKGDYYSLSDGVPQFPGWN